MKREIIEIDEEKCTGCGDCILACAEGALELVDGKAKLLSDVYCDGLGACIGDCPEDAIKIIVRDAEEFDEEKVEEHLSSLKTAQGGPHQYASGGHRQSPLACGCPGSHEMELEKSGHTSGIQDDSHEIASELIHWPIKLKLIGPQAPFLKGRRLLLLADCAAAAFPNLHRKLLAGHAVALGCPKFDNHDEDVQRLAAIISEANLTSITIVHMEVPCCSGYLSAVEEAINISGIDIDVNRIMIGRNGEIMDSAPILESSRAHAGA